MATYSPCLSPIRYTYLGGKHLEGNNLLCSPTFSLSLGTDFLRAVCRFNYEASVWTPRFGFSAQVGALKDATSSRGGRRMPGGCSVTYSHRCGIGSQDESE